MKLAWNWQVRIFDHAGIRTIEPNLLRTLRYLLSASQLHKLHEQKLFEIGEGKRWIIKFYLVFSFTVNEHYYTSQTTSKSKNFSPVRFVELWWNLQKYRWAKMNLTHVRKVAIITSYRVVFLSFSIDWDAKLVQCKKNIRLSNIASNCQANSRNSKITGMKSISVFSPSTFGDGQPFQ